MVAEAAAPKSKHTQTRAKAKREELHRHAKEAAENVKEKTPPPTGATSSH
jgi:hypothetical protein